MTLRLTGPEKFLATGSSGNTPGEMFELEGVLLLQLDVEPKALDFTQRARLAARASEALCTFGSVQREPPNRGVGVEPIQLVASALAAAPIHLWPKEGKQKCFWRSQNL